MDGKLAVLLLCATLTTLLKESCAVKCYECTSTLGSDKSCEDEFNKKAAVQTKECSYGCSKLKGKKDDAQIVVRDCAVAPQDDGCASQEAGGAEGQYCVCNKDLCNTAMITNISVIGLLLATISAVFNQILF